MSLHRTLWNVYVYVYMEERELENSALRKSRGHIFQSYLFRIHYKHYKSFVTCLFLSFFLVEWLRYKPPKALFSSRYFVYAYLCVCVKTKVIFYFISVTTLRVAFCVYSEALLCTSSNHTLEHKYFSIFIFTIIETERYIYSSGLYVSGLKAFKELKSVGGHERGWMVKSLLFQFYFVCLFYFSIFDTLFFLACIDPSFSIQLYQLENGSTNNQYGMFFRYVFFLLQEFWERVLRVLSLFSFRFLFLFFILFHILHLALTFGILFSLLYFGIFSSLFR